MSSRKDLKGCPFCGAAAGDGGPTAQWVKWGPDRVSYNVVCDCCGASSRMYSMSVDDQDRWRGDKNEWNNPAYNNAVWAWNRREGVPS